MRFSIRDLLWLTLVVALGLGWWLSYEATDAKRLAAVQQARRQWVTLVAAKGSYDLALRKTTPTPPFVSPSPWAFIVDWSVLDEPLVEP
jgi:hypothetical protein